MTTPTISDTGTGYQLPVYPFRLPPELEPEGSAARDRARQTIHPLVIIGGGLAGLTAACDCASRGLPAIVLDEDDTIGVRGASSRGICYSQRTLEILARFGVYPRVRDKGIQWFEGRTLAGRDEVYHFDLAKQPALSHSAQPAFINIQQFYIEWFLVDRIAELGGGVDLRWKNRVSGLAVTDGAVTLTVETPAGSYPLRAGTVIDATGVRSPIRDWLGLKTQAAHGIDRWCISDVRFRHRPPIERWTWIEAPFNDNRAVWQHLMADDVWRLDYQMAPDSDPEAVSRPEVVADRLRHQFGDGVDYELVWVGPYGYRSHVMETFRHGPVFFAGDCAHGMSPFGARGGNSGIQDADNLVWKLDWVARGWAAPSLLDSYDSERREGAEVNVLVTNRTARFLSPRSPVERMIRNAVVDLARRHPFARNLVNTGRMSVASTYTRSPLAEAPLAAAGIDAPGAGQPLQNLALAGDVADLVSLIRGGDGRMIVVAPDAATAARVPAAWHAAGWPLVWTIAAGAVEPVVAGGAVDATDATGPRSGWQPIAAAAGARAPLAESLGLIPGRLLLIRPDLHSAGCIEPTVLPALLGVYGVATAAAAAPAGTPAPPRPAARGGRS
ncbi:MAG: FAD-dependent monooxygenase [Lautropia sp.]